jgi:hypothetical protein
VGCLKSCNDRKKSQSASGDFESLGRIEAEWMQIFAWDHRRINYRYAIGFDMVKEERA